MTYPLVVDLAADGIPVSRSCQVLGFSTQAFYRWKSHPISNRDLEDAYVMNTIIDIHHEDPTLGYRFICDELGLRGIKVGENRVARLCQLAGVASVTVRKRGSKGRSGPAVHDDLVQRHFRAPGPNQVWLTDITEHPTREGKLYLCAIKDVYSNMIVGYAIDHRMTSTLAINALRMATLRRGDVSGCVMHSDRGGQFRSRAFTTQLRDLGITGSMGRVGAAGDNAAMESFFALLQRNVLNRRYWRTRDELRLEIAYWIEARYNRRRRQRALGKQTPAEYEILNTAAPAA